MSMWPGFVSFVYTLFLSVAGRGAGEPIPDVPKAKGKAKGKAQAMPLTLEFKYKPVAIVNIHESINFTREEQPAGIRIALF